MRAEAAALVIEIVQLLLGACHSDKKALLFGGQLSRVARAIAVNRSKRVLHLGAWVIDWLRAEGQASVDRSQP